jgi:serpin B
MYLEDTVQAIINDDVTAVKLPYGDKSWSMYLFMPPAGTNPDTWSEDVLPKEWDNLRRSFVSVPGQELYLPQFKVESSLELGNQLKALGMPTAFGGAADFSKLGPGSLAISQVLHKTYIDVNEEGTEAAAVTAVIITRTSFPINQLRFNRPFVFVIAEEETGAILFVGKIVHL